MNTKFALDNFPLSKPQCLALDFHRGILLMKRRRSLRTHKHSPHLKPMKRLPQAIITLMTLTFLGSPIAAFARDADVIRPDGHSLQNVYSLRGHFMFVNRVSKRNIKLVTLPKEPMVTQREII